MKNEQWIVGAEHDEKLFDALSSSLRALGYSLGPKSWGVGGSQEISNWVVNGPINTGTPYLLKLYIVEVRG